MNLTVKPFTPQPRPRFGALSPDQRKELAQIAQSTRKDQGNIKKLEAQIITNLKLLNTFATLPECKDDFNQMETELGQGLDKVAEIANPFVLQNVIGQLEQLKQYVPSETIFEKLKNAINKTHYIDVITAQDAVLRK